VRVHRWRLRGVVCVLPGGYTQQQGPQVMAKKKMKKQMATSRNSPAPFLQSVVLWVPPLPSGVSSVEQPTLYEARGQGKARETFPFRSNDY
jgi:hypothetical protein